MPWLAPHIVKVCRRATVVDWELRVVVVIVQHALAARPVVELEHRGRVLGGAGSACKSCDACDGGTEGGARVRSKPAEEK
jgi:hypothetical protein